MTTNKQSKAQQIRSCTEIQYTSIIDFRNRYTFDKCKNAVSKRVNRYTISFSNNTASV